MTDAEIISQTATIKAGMSTKIYFSLDGTGIASDAEVEFQLSYKKYGSDFFTASITNGLIVLDGTTYEVTIPQADSVDFVSGTAFFALYHVDTENVLLAAGKITIQKFL